MDLWQACRDGNVVLAKQFLDTTDPNQRDERDCAALHWAALGDRLDIIRILIERGADVNIIGGDLMAPPIHWAIS